ncbi:hypothetical protein GCM10028807_36040 [Spirosoma daeguense]
MLAFRITAFLFFIFVANHFSSGQTRPSQAEQVDALVQREMRERQIPGLQLAVVQHGQIILSKSYGIANIQHAVPVTKQTVFSINSCTKAFTGVAIMQLVEEGKIDLEAPVSNYLDSLPTAWQSVKIRQLLTHVSGIPDILRKVLDPNSGGFTGRDTEQTAWAKVLVLPMEFPTGAQFSYNQTNYVLLGKIIDKFRQKPFIQVFKELQFQGADMPSTGFGDSRDVIPNKSQSYRYINRFEGKNLSEPKLTNAYEEFPAFKRTSSGINSTAGDVARWLIALQQGKLLKTKSALTKLWTAGTYNNGKPTQWALGWMTKPRPKHHAIIATGGGRSAFFVYPDDDISVVVLTNLGGAYPEEFIDELAGYFNAEIPVADPITALHMQLRQQGFAKAIDVYNEIQKKDPNFRPTEDELNDWAYRLMSRGQLKESLAIFKLNVHLFPKSYNVYDSYGEALFRNGQKEESIALYRKSIELNPNNQNGKDMLERLSK